MVARWRGVKRKKAGGPRLRRRVEEKIEKREGAPGAAGDNSSGRHRPPADEHGRRSCRAIGEGGGVQRRRRGRLIGGARRRRGPVAATGCGRERERVGQRGAGR
jgi:hypothetical protein